MQLEENMPCLVVKIIINADSTFFFFLLFTQTISLVDFWLHGLFFNFLFDLNKLLPGWQMENNLMTCAKCVPLWHQLCRHLVVWCSCLRTCVVCTVGRYDRDYDVLSVSPNLNRRVPFCQVGSHFTILCLLIKIFLNQSWHRSRAFRPNFREELDRFHMTDGKFFLRLYFLPDILSAGV